MSQEATANVLDCIRRLSRALRVAAQETQAMAGVSAAQLFVLRSLDDGEAASVSDLAERTMTDRSSVASVVERLIQARLVSRTAAATDRRRAAITITAKGRAVARKAPAAPTTLVLDAVSSLSPRDLKALSTGLTSLVEAMGLEDRPTCSSRSNRGRRSAERYFSSGAPPSSW